MSILFFLQKREIDNKKLSLYSQQYMIYMINVCKNNHKYGYSPVTKYGTCRFCWGKKPCTFTEFINNYNTIQYLR